MTQQFHVGQEVEVLRAWRTPQPYGEPGLRREWRKAKILGRGEPYSKTWRVEFPDGTRGVADAEHIRAVEPSVFFKDGDPNNPIVCIAGKVLP